jgi:hypothetical protein
MKKILAAVLKRLGGCSKYRLSQLTGISEQVMFHWEHKDSKMVRLAHLAKLRKASGLTWEQIGKLIDSDD